jgi:hypothetical protein
MKDEEAIGTGKLFIDPYLNWIKREGVPIHEGFGINLHKVEVKPWARTGVKGAAVHVAGRGDFMTLFVIELPPGGQTLPQKHLYEETILVLSGHGSTTVEDHAGVSHTFEWGPNSLFAPPLNCRYQHFNGSGREPVRLAISCNLPATLNLFHSESFVFDNPCKFPEREGAASHFTGEGDYIDVRPGKHMWESNFIPDLANLTLQKWAARGADSSHIQLIMADGVLHAHLSEMPVGTYKKAHRHGPDLHVYCITGSGYSLFWFEGDKEFTRVDWEHGWVFAPADMMFHQHFNKCAEPVRYLAVGHGSVRYPFTAAMWTAYRGGVDSSTKTGGNQIDYTDQDPRVHQIYIDEMAKVGLKPKMEKFIPA